MAWDPDTYLDFTDARRRPATDLLERIPLAPGDVRHVVDLGAGSGNLVPVLRRHFPTARITCVDNDPAMLERARQATADDELVEVVDADLATWHTHEKVDLLFSNAALHWADDHQQLFPRLAGQVFDDGVLAVQMPMNHDAPSHRALASVAGHGPWADTLRPLLREHPVASPEQYHRILRPHADHLDVWSTTYVQQLGRTEDGSHPVAHWMRGSTLRPLLASLNDHLAGAFWEAFEAAIGAAYLPEADGTVLFPFTRVFVVARA